MQVLLVIVLLSITVSCIIKYYLVPRSKINAYRKYFEEKGFRVYQFPYKMFTYPIIQTIYKDSKKGDALYTYKHEFINYDVILANHLHHPSISLLNPQLRKQFAKLQKDFNYEKFSSVSSSKARFAGRGLAFSEGQDWKRKRRIMGSLFTFDLIKQNIKQIQKICLKVMDEMETIDHSNKSNIFQFQVEELASSIFSKVIVCLFLGLKTVDLRINGRPIGKYILELANDANVQARGMLTMILGVRYLDLGLTRKDKQINARLKVFKNWIDDFVNDEIGLQEKLGKYQGKQKNLLSIHLNSKQQINNKLIQFQDRYNKQELIEELKIFLLAGTETSTNFFRMVIYYVNQNPEVQDKLREQIKLVKDNGLDLETLKKLKYLQAVQKQTIRMYGPTNFNFPRIVVKDHHLLGIPIRKNTVIQYHSICTHYNPQFYEDPHKFNPDRWVHLQQDKAAALLVGFGLGPRNCIGQHLALVQSKVAIIKFYQRYSNVKIPNLPTQFKWKFLYKPDDFKVRVIKN